MRLFFRIFIAIGTICMFVFKRQAMKFMHIPDERTYWLRMLTYSLAGITILFVRKPLFHLFGITDQTPMWVIVLAYIPLISTTYMIGFVVYGILLGQKDFVLGKAKNRFNLILRYFKHVKH